MGVKASEETRSVERRELMNRARRQAPPEQLRRRHGAARDQGGEPALREPFDQRQQREGLPDAGPVQPDQRAGGPRDARRPSTLAET